MITVNAGVMVELDLDVETVWKQVKNFKDVSWTRVKFKLECKKEKEEIGTVRTITYPEELGGSIIKEKLIAYSDKEHCFSYTVFEIDSEPSLFIGTLHIDSHKNKTRARYFCTDTIKEKDKEEIEKRNQGVIEMYRKAFLGLK